MKVSGFTFVRNGLRLGYPFVESIYSLLPLVDELIINVPCSQDETLNKIRSIDNPKISVFESDWDENLREGGKILSMQTNRALNQCTGDWAIYLQADEILHEADYPIIKNAMKQLLNRRDIDGISFKFLHFEAGYYYINPFRYRRQVRIVRNNGSIESYGDACGFQKKDGRKLRSKKIRARVFHYGWARPPEKMLEKNRELEKLYHDDNYISRKYDDKINHEYKDLSVCLRFRDNHPDFMKKVIANSSINLKPPKTLIPYPLRPKVWRWLFKKWGIFR